MHEAGIQHVRCFHVVPGSRFGKFGLITSAHVVRSRFRWSRLSYGDAVDPTTPWNETTRRRWASNRRVSGRGENPRIALRGSLLDSHSHAERHWRAFSLVSSGIQWSPSRNCNHPRTLAVTSGLVCWDISTQSDTATIESLAWECELSRAFAVLTSLLLLGYSPFTSETTFVMFCQLWVGLQASKPFFLSHCPTTIEKLALTR